MAKKEGQREGERERGKKEKLGRFTAGIGKAKTTTGFRTQEREVNDTRTDTFLQQQYVGLAFISRVHSTFIVRRC